MTQYGSTLSPMSKFSGFLRGTPVVYGRVESHPDGGVGAQRWLLELVGAFLVLDVVLDH